MSQILKDNHTKFLENSEYAHSQQNVMASQMKQLRSELKNMIAIGRPLEEKSRKCVHILKSLQYKRMIARRENIVEAHVKTFEWIYDESLLSQHGDLQHHFLQWLKNGNGIFWVTGKAGSGKSTLMKFITEHPKTRQALSQWTSHQYLITAGFYFWHAGTALQKSQEGLLRSLLYEILRQCPNMIPDVLSERWALCEQSNPAFCEWSRTELVNALTKFSSQLTMPKGACLFIDGLDEYDGDHVELIHLLQGFSQPKNIKICASSRPWNVFGTAFGGGSRPMIRLQDLTRNDIKLYIRETLEQNDLFNQLRKRENAHCVELVEEVANKAQGVFLWVFLVVRSLITGLTNADRITDLRRRLRLLPADLESYFRHMLANIDPFYEEQTAQTFKIALHVSEPQNIMTYVMVDELGEDPEFALHLDIREWQSTEIRSQTESMVLRINARGMGLLEVVPNKDSDGLGGDEVDFLHRTVRDFFRLKEPEDWITRRLPPSFNPDQLLYNAILAQIKAMSVNLRRDSRKKLVLLVDDMMRYAHNLETNLKTAPTILLDNLSHTISQHMLAYSEGELGNGNANSVRQIRQWCTSFLSFAVQKDLKLYVAEKLYTRSSSTRSEDAYLICRALWPDISERPIGNRAMLDLLLKKGMHITEADDGWDILFCDIADGWSRAREEEKILQLETIRTLVARENPGEAIGASCWNSLVVAISRNWLSGSIKLQKALKTTMLLLLETVSELDPAYGARFHRYKFLLEISDGIKTLEVGPASKEIILEVIRVYLQHGASHPHYVWNLIAALWEEPDSGSLGGSLFFYGTKSRAQSNVSIFYEPYGPATSSLSNTWTDIGQSGTKFETICIRL